MPDTDYVTQREFDRTVRTLELAMNTGQARIDAELRRLTDAINVRNATSAAPPPELLSMAAAFNRSADMLEKQARKGGSGSVVIGSVAMAFALVAAAVIIHMFVGHW